MDGLETVAEHVEVTPEIPETETSLASHAEAFDPRRPEPTEPVEAPAVPQERTRHRARSAEAAPDEVAQINALTRDLRQKEAELAKIKPDAMAGSPRLRVLQRQIKAIEAELGTAQPETPIERPAPRTEPVRPAAPPVTATSTFDQTEPKLDDFTASDDPYSAWQRAIGKWDRAKERFDELQQQRTQEGNARDAQLASGYASRVQAFKATSPDYDAVIAPIAGEELTPLLRQAILEDDNGPALAYHLGQNQHVFYDMLLLTEGKEVTPTTVATLRRRLNSELSRTQAVSTGSAAATPRPAPLAPRPPNPVRTGAMKTGDDPPGDGHSLADHAKHYSPKRR